MPEESKKGAVATFSPYWITYLIFLALLVGGMFANPQDWHGAPLGTMLLAAAIGPLFFALPIGLVISAFATPPKTRVTTATIGQEHTPETGIQKQARRLLFVMRVLGVVAILASFFFWSLGSLFFDDPTASYSAFVASIFLPLLGFMLFGFIGRFLYYKGRYALSVVLLIVAILVLFLPHLYF